MEGGGLQRWVFREVVFAFKVQISRFIKMRQRIKFCMGIARKDVELILNDELCNSD